MTNATSNTKAVSASDKLHARVLFITQAAMIAAIYVVLTVFISAFGLASGAIQVRVSEALTILPYFTPAAIPGLWIGCIIANTITGCAFYDIVFGSLATLIGAIGSYLLRKNKYLVPIPPIVSNALIIPWVLRLVYEVPDAIGFLIATVGIGEILSCGVLGMLLLLALEKYKNVIFK